MKNEGVKFDEEKIRLDLIPPQAIFALGEILTIGAKKYGEYNWLKGMEWYRVFGACLRHLWAWWASPKPDPESGKSHLWHALACISFLIVYEQEGIGTDNRPFHKVK